MSSMTISHPTLSIKRRIVPLFIAFLLLILPRCSKKPISLVDLLPTSNQIMGWELDGEVKVFNTDNLFSLVDGQADFYFAYGFNEVAVGSYTDASGAKLRLEVWQMANPADAYGLFTARLSGEPYAIGTDGDFDPGKRIAFWQDHYWVQVRSLGKISDETLKNFSQSIVSKLPTNGGRPDLVNKLPKQGLIDRSTIFFRLELSIQDLVWLGGQNILGLSQESAGITARYDLEGKVVRLLLIQYPDAQAASNGLAAFTSNQVEGLITEDAKGKLLGAVFGDAKVELADQLLALALGGE